MKNKVRAAAPEVKNSRPCPQIPAMLLRTMRKSLALTFPAETGMRPSGLPLWAAEETCPPVPCTTPTQGGHVPISQYCAFGAVGAGPARETLRKSLISPSREMGSGCLGDQTTLRVSPPADGSDGARGWYGWVIIPQIPKQRGRAGCWEQSLPVPREPSAVGTSSEHPPEGEYRQHHVRSGIC